MEVQLDPPWSQILTDEISVPYSRKMMVLENLFSQKGALQAARKPQAHARQHIPHSCRPAVYAPHGAQSIFPGDLAQHLRGFGL